MTRTAIFLIAFGSVAAAGAAAEGMAWIEPFLQVGGTGCVLLWFMLRAETRMKGMESSVDRMARAELLGVLANELATAAIKQQAHDILHELDKKAEES